jgi:hypothetical protein
MHGIPVRPVAVADACRDSTAQAARRGGASVITSGARPAGAARDVLRRTGHAVRLLHHRYATGLRRLFASIATGQSLPVRNSRLPWFMRWYSVRKLYGLSAGFALGGAAWLSYAVSANVNWVYIGIGVLWLALAANIFLQARQLRRRKQLGFDHESPEAGQDVQALLAQGRKIEAIKRYRQLNPGIGLREAKHVIDEL